MRVEAFCPGHITCFFRPCRDESEPLRSGSVGAGLCLELGAIARAEDGDGVELLFSGSPAEARVTRRALEILGVDGVTVDIDHQLPLGQGMGMSAAGALSACLAVAELRGIPREDAFRTAHLAELEMGGGMGDVSGLLGTGQSTRRRAGIPPHGEVCSQAWELEISLAFLGPPLATAEILRDERRMSRIDSLGAEALQNFLQNPSMGSLFKEANEFSSGCGLESDALQKAMELVRPHAYCGMAMLGNALYMAGDLDQAESALAVPCRRVRLDLLGPRIIRKG